MLGHINPMVKRVEMQEIWSLLNKKEKKIANEIALEQLQNLLPHQRLSPIKFTIEIKDRCRNK